MPEAGRAEVSVRVARLEDAAAVASLTLRAWRVRLPADALTRAALPEPDQADAQWRAAISHPGANLLLVAVSGGAVVGYAAIGPADGPGAEIGELVVASDQQRHGHGSRLLAAAVEHLQRAGHTSVLTWVGLDDTARQQFLASAGFADDGLTRVLDLDGTGAVTIRQHRWSALLAWHPCSPDITAHRVVSSASPDRPQVTQN